jgi:succinate-semialdehyde dehydrogenase/glutarate-semialdehyde dehydrogenase
VKVADGFEPGTVFGPLIDMKAVEEVEAHIADAVKKGAKVVLGGKRAAQGGSFLRAECIDRRDDGHGHHQGGNLSPCRPALRFKTDAEAIKPSPN